MSDIGSSPDSSVHRRILDRAGDAVVSVDDEFRYTYFNQAAEELFGKTESEVLGEVVWDVFPEIEGSVAHQEMQIALETQQEREYERYNESIGGRFEVLVYPDEQGLSLLYTDVTEPREYEQKLNSLHDATREMVSATTPEEVAAIVTETADRSIGFQMNGVHLYDETADGLVPVSVSAESQGLIGEVPTLRDGFAWEAFQRGESRRSPDLHAETAVHNEQTPFRSELAVPIGDHGVFIASATETAAFDQRDMVLAETLANNAQTALTQLQATRELRQRERELERNKEFLQQTARVAQMGGWEVDVETGELDWTVEVYRIHGLEVGEPPSLEDAIDAYHPEDRERIESAWDRLVEDGEPYDLEVRIVTADDVTRWVRTIGIPEYDDAGDEIVTARGVFQDITTRTEREQELRQYRKAIESSEDLIIAIGTDGKYIFANSRYTEYYGEDAIAGKSVPAVVGEETFETVIKPHHEQALAGQSVSYERTERFPRIGERTLAVKYTPVQDDDSLLGFVGVLRDITEKTQYQDQLEAQRNNLEVLNTMVRHDIRNDIQLIQTYVEILKSRSESDEIEYVEEILEAAQNAIEITDSAKDITDVMLQSNVDFTPVSLRAVLEDEIHDIRASYEGTVVDVKGPIPDVTIGADEMLGSVFRNLLSNAVQHNDKEVPEITVSARATDRRAVVHIADNGPGIPDEQKATIFEEEQMSLESEGTGLGLYLVETLVDRYGGQVRVVDNEPEGTVFIVSLPVTKQRSWTD